MPPPPPEAAAPSTRYQVVRALGRGGVGSVLLAHDKELDREVALKVLQTPGSPELLDRFRCEAEAMVGLEHPNLVRLLDHALDGPRPVLVMEYLPGRDLTKPPTPDPVPTMLEVGKGLAALHGAGLLHREVKPANILVTESGRVVLTEIGLAACADPETLTRTGQLLEMQAYLAPEIFRTGIWSTASDWYAWGMTLYVLIEGKTSLSGVTPESLLAGGPLPPFEFQQVADDSREATAIRACMDPDPDARPGNLQALRRLLDPEEPPARADAVTEALEPPSSSQILRTSTPAHELEMMPGPRASPPLRRSPWGKALGAAVLAALLVYAIERLAAPPPANRPWT